MHNGRGLVPKITPPPAPTSRATVQPAIQGLPGIIIDERMQVAGENYMNSIKTDERNERMWASDGFSKGWLAAMKLIQERGGA